MTTEGLCETGDWSNDAKKKKNQLCILKYIQAGNSYFVYSIVY